MLALLYLVALVLLLKPVWAGGRPGAYERVWIWYAYRIDQLNPPERQKIATGCRTRTGDPIGHCYFTELMEFIDSPQTYSSWFNSADREWLPNDPKNLSPDVSAGEGMVQSNKIPERFTPGNVMGPGTRSYTGMFQKIAEVIRDTRGSLSPEDLEKHKALFNTADQCLHKSIGFRRNKMHFHMDTARRRRGSGIEDIVVRWVNDEEFGRFLDFAGAENDPINRGRPNVGNRLNNWIHRNYIVAAGNSPTDVEQSHYSAIQKIKQARDIAHASCGGNI